MLCQALDSPINKKLEQNFTDRTDKLLTDSLLCPIRETEIHFLEHINEIVLELPITAEVLVAAYQAGNFRSFAPSWEAAIITVNVDNDSWCQLLL